MSRADPPGPEDTTPWPESFMNVKIHGSRTARLALAVLAIVAWAAAGQPTGAAAESPDPAMAALDARLAARPDDLEARAERARLRAAQGRHMGAYLDRLEIL